MSTAQPPAPLPGLIEGYELLRRERSAGRRGGLLGYAVLVHRGLAEWIRIGSEMLALDRTTRPGPLPSSTTPGISDLNVAVALPEGVAPTLVGILAGLFQNLDLEAHHERN